MNLLVVQYLQSIYDLTELLLIRWYCIEVIAESIFSDPVKAGVVPLLR